MTSGASLATPTGAAVNSYDYLKPRPPGPVQIPSLETTPPFLIHPSTNPYVETPTAKYPCLTSYDLSLRDSGQGSSSETIEQELESLENRNQNNNELVVTDTVLDTTV